MTESRRRIDEILRELHSSLSVPGVPSLRIATELEQVQIDAGQVETIFAALIETISLLKDSYPLQLQAGIVGAPTQRRFGASADGNFLTISLGSASLPMGCIDHTPDKDFGNMPSLAKLQKLVNDSGGTLLVTEIGGRLRRLRCILPLATTEKEREKSGHETILLVEDEEFVRNITREVLELSGYNVLEAIDAEMGIQIFQEHADMIDLLLTDVVMPGMNGHELALRLFEVAPTLKVIFMSGYTENAITRQGLSDSRLVYLQKPFTLDVLTRKVREVLDRTLESGAQLVTLGHNAKELPQTSV